MHPPNRTATITAESLLPEVVSCYPSTRAVFDQYGLQGCGGPLGPHEQVGWFARLHGVSIDRLLAELNEAAKSALPIAEFSPSSADSIYRPFFLAGIATVLTLGCVWGAINLLTIALRENFSAISYSWVLAHGHAMVFGFVGLFIMGFAYQAVPRFKHTTLWRPRLACSSLPLMIAGIVLQTIAHLLSPPSLSLEVIASILQMGAVVIFAGVMVQTIRQVGKHEMYDRFLYAALAWFLVAAIANPIIFKLFELSGSREQLLFNLSTFNIPYRDVQLMGLAVVMILGFSLRLLPHAYGFREPSRRWMSFLFWGVNGAILGGVAFFIAGMTSGNHWLLILQWLASIVLLLIAIMTPFQYRLFGAVAKDEQDRGLKFIRAAHVWFIIATAMLVFTPIYNFGIYMPITGSHVPFSHAYFGAYRHALTVGFIMMMIVGVSSKVVPTLSGIDPRRANSLWPTFVLLNLGNLTRVSFQIATDFSPAAYRVMGVSGFIEVIGLTLWGYELFANMRLGKKFEREAIVLNPLQPLHIAPDTKVGEVLARYPESLEIFVRRGFTLLRNPVLRKTMTRAITMEQACRRERVDLAGLLDEIRQLTQTNPNKPERLVLITRSHQTQGT